MEYSYGYVAFIDILGFKNLVLDEDNLEKVNTLFRFVNAVQKSFNNANNYTTKVAFFSDSIIITTEDTKLESLLQVFTLIHLVESDLHQITGLYTRGGITKGKYCYSNTSVFGPAIVHAYNLENSAIYSRILINSSLAEELLKTNQPYSFSIDIMKDYDGEYYYNSFYYDVISAIEEKKTLTIDMVYKKIQDVRDLTIASIKKYLHTVYIEKYLWRARAFNRSLCIISRILDELKVTYQKSDIIKFINLWIDTEKIAYESGEQYDQL